MAKLRWGILSTARIANAIVTAAKEAAFGEVVAVASRDPVRAHAWAAERGIPRVFESYDAMLASDEVDAIYNPLPNSLHREWTVRAAEFGKHVLCEKPLTVYAAEVDEIMDSAARHDVHIMEAFMYRFHPQIRLAHERVVQGDLGAIRLVRASHDYFNRRPVDVRWDPELGGGALLDVGSYCVNAATLFIPARCVAVSAAAQYTERGVDTLLSGVLEFENGSQAVMDCSFGLRYLQRLELHGAEGRLTIPAPWRQGSDPTELHLDREDKSETLTAPGANEYAAMLDHFSQCVLEKRPVEFSLSTTRENMRILEALAQSAREERRIEL